MKLGIITAPTPAGLRRVAELGLEAAEFDLNVGADLAAVWQDRAALRQAAAETGVAVGAIGRWGPDRVSEAGVIEEELQREQQLLALCGELSCPVYITGCNRVEGLSLYDNATLAIDYLSRLITAARPLGVKVCTYNCHWNTFLDCDPGWSIVHGHLKELGIKFDPSHSLAGGRDYLAEMRQWGHRFAHIHLKGSLYCGGEHVDDPPAGLDGTDWSAFMAMLYYLHYDGMLAIEPHSPTWQGNLGEAGLQYTIETFRKMVF